MRLCAVTVAAMARAVELLQSLPARLVSIPRRNAGSRAGTATFEQASLSLGAGQSRETRFNASELVSLYPSGLALSMIKYFWERN